MAYQRNNGTIYLTIAIADNIVIQKQNNDNGYHLLRWIPVNIRNGQISNHANHMSGRVNRVAGFVEYVHSFLPSLWINHCLPRPHILGRLQSYETRTRTSQFSSWQLELGCAESCNCCDVNGVVNMPLVLLHYSALLPRPLNLASPPQNFNGTCSYYLVVTVLNK
jgi:hypothetical protein